MGALSVLLSVDRACATSWYLELKSETIDERAMRQAIALELAEIEIPPNPNSDVDDEVSLHIEISQSETRLIVTLWDRGELAGRRGVSGSGDPRLVARRIGLAVAELARDLRDRRARTERLLSQEQRFIERRALVSAYRAQQRALGIRVGLRTEILTQGAFAFGPTAGVEFNDKFPLRFVAGVAWTTGWIDASSKTEGLGKTPPWSKWQLEWGADWVVQPQLHTQLSAGLHFGASVIHVGSGIDLDGIAGQSETWGAQMGLRLAWASELGLEVWPRLELEVGRVLRPTPLAWQQASDQLGGWFVTIGVSAMTFQ